MARDLGGYESLQDVSMLSSTITTKEHLQLCCKPTYKPRRVKNKGAVFVLVMNVYYFLSQYQTRNMSGYESLVWQVAFQIGLTLPIAGWLADTYIGRYKVICCSVWMMWIATVLATVSSVIAQLVDVYSHIDARVNVALFVFMAIGLGGYQANIIQFGIDQLHDASTTEIKSFIIWYVWTILSAGIIIDFFSACLNQKYIITRLLLVSTNLTLALVLLFCCNHWLIKEPVKHSSFQQVYTVIKYAIKNKYPRQRSAFTYCEDELPSLIDFGKSKYGGPFTTEQVEDVKTFLLVLPVTIVSGALVGGIIASNFLWNKLRDMFIEYSKLDLNASKMSSIKCYSEASLTHTIYYSAILIIVLHEILFYPIFHRCLPRLESIQKAFIGMFLQLVRLLILMAYQIVAQHNYSVVNSNNITTPCLFYAHQGTLSSSFDYHWMAIPDFIVSISYMILYTGAVEYFSAHVFYFMKGLTVGVTYSSVFLSGAVWLILSIPFTNRALSYIPVTSCGFWYGLLLTIVETTICIILIILTKWYKKKRRQDVLPNEHIFAERYYSTFT